MSAHWKHRATRCAVIGCERQREHGWSTCYLLSHHALGRPLQGAGRIEPIPNPNRCDSLAVTIESEAS